MIQGLYFIIQTTAAAFPAAPAVTTASDSNSSAAPALPTTSDSVPPSIPKPSDPPVSAPAPIAPSSASLDLAPVTPSSGPPAGELSLEEVLNRATIHNTKETYTSPARVAPSSAPLDPATVALPSGPPAAVQTLEEALNGVMISPKKVKKVRFHSNNAFVSLFIL